MTIALGTGLSMFISYSHSDRLLAANLSDSLQAAGVRVWIDQGELRVGDSIIERISDAINEVDFFIALVTRNSVKSNWCRKELSLASSVQLQKSGVRVLPVRVGEVAMPRSLSDTLYVQFDSGDEAAVVERLIKDARIHSSERRKIRTRVQRGNRQGSRPASEPSRRRLGRELRRFRDLNGLAGDQVADVLGCSPSKIYRIEAGRVSATTHDVIGLLDLYGVRGKQRDNLMQLARDAQSRTSWWDAFRDIPNVRTLTSFEWEAASIAIYESAAIPDLLQTEQYAREILRTRMPALSPQQFERHIKLRMVRQSQVFENNPPMLQVVLDEAPLRRIVGGHEIMHDQLRRIADVASMPNLTLRILSFHGPGSTSGPFTIFRFDDASVPDLLYLEHFTGEFYIEDVGDVERYHELFQALSATALRPEDSLRFLYKLIETTIW